MLWAFVFEEQPDRRLTSEQLAVYTATLARRTPLLRATRDDLSAVPDPRVVPVGSIEFVRALAARWGAEEALLATTLPDYPKALRGFLAREPVLTTWGAARVLSGPLFVKPRSTRDRKLFTGHVFAPDERAHGHYPDTLPVWVCAPLPPLLGEHRVYIRAGHILGLGRYDDADTSDDDAAPDTAVLADMVATMGASAPTGYALDVGVCNGHTILIEATDAWAIGYYRGTCSAAEYTAMLAARWNEIMTGVSSTQAIRPAMGVQT